MQARPSDLAASASIIKRTILVFFLLCFSFGFFFFKRKSVEFQLTHTDPANRRASRMCCVIQFIIDGPMDEPPARIRLPLETYYFTG